MINAQKYLDEKYPNKDERGAITILRRDKNSELQGHLDLSDFVNLEVLNLVNYSSWDEEYSAGKFLTKITTLDVSKCSKLKVMVLPRSLKKIVITNNPLLFFLSWEGFSFSENEMVGWQKTSLSYLALTLSIYLDQPRDKDYNFWNTYLEKHQIYYPEMALINASDLTELANQVNEETVNSEIFLVQFCPHESEEFIKRYKGDYFRIFNQLSSRLITRCLILQNRLYQGVDPEYEKRITDLSLKCIKNYQLSEEQLKAAYIPTRQELVNKVLNSDPELINRIKDLPWIKNEFKKLITQKRSTQISNLIMNNKQLNQVKNTHQSQSRDLTTILFSSSADISNIPFSAVKTQAKEIMKRVKLGAELGAWLESEEDELKKSLKQELTKKAKKINQLENEIIKLKFQLEQSRGLEANTVKFSYNN